MNGLKTIYVLVALTLVGINTTRAQEFTFNHDFHVKQQSISCKRCHGFTKYKKPSELVQKQLCHSCHVDKSPEQAVLSCKSCHGNVKVKPTQKRPSFHNIHGFKRDHAMMASKDQQSCMQCHKKSDCSDCHNRARSLSTSPHSAFFLKTHGQEAKMGVNNCSACHSKNTCTECHGRSL